MKIKMHFLITLLWCFIHLPSMGQNDSLMRSKAPRVFVDCGNMCDMSYIKQMVPYLNYVRDRKLADIHVLITDRETASGGMEISMFFIGKREYREHQDTIVFTITPNTSEQQIYEISLRYFQLGLIPVLMKTPLIDHISVLCDLETDPVVEEDKWNNWVFMLEGGGFVNGQSITSNQMYWAGVDISKVTPEWKLLWNGETNFNRQMFDLGDTVVVGLVRSNETELSLIKSLGEHWGVGAFSGYENSLFENYKHHVEIGPGIEYNVYKYSESARRQLRIMYMIQGVSNSYFTETVLNKLSEFTAINRFGIFYGLREEWGTINVGTVYNSYLHNPKFFKVSLGGYINLALFKGFALEIGGNYNFIKDQITLPLEDASDSEILLNQRVLPTAFYYFSNFGINYTFGSIYNTVVNPRFDDD